MRGPVRFLYGFLSVFEVVQLTPFLIQLWHAAEPSRLHLAVRLARADSLVWQT
jgi:hypothetical protein